MWHAHLRRLLETDVSISLAGDLAEELGVRMLPSEPAREDRKEARKLAFALASMSNRELAELTKTEAGPRFPSDQEHAQATAETLSGEQGSAHMSYLREVTRSLVHQLSIRDAILAVADKLYDEEVLSGRAVKRIADITPFGRPRRKEK